MIDRRRFIQTLVASGAVHSASVTVANIDEATGFGRLHSDPDGILDLPGNFSYRVISTRGAEMDDGLLVPGRADGMAAFAGEDGRIILVCNHENVPGFRGDGPFGKNLQYYSRVDRSRVYDRGDDKTPGTGGTTHIIFNPQTGETESRFLSLGGTEKNCAGGATPWGSWLSCEECFTDHALSLDFVFGATRRQRHGYVFEVPAATTGLIEPVPLTDMGRFEHEAAAVDPRSGAVFLSEDRHRSLLYRFLPEKAGQLAEGGRLQALAVRGKPSFDTRNWSVPPRLPVGHWLDVEWVQLHDVDSDENDLRLRGYDAGAARFARGEGLCYADGSLFLTCTIGGAERFGQVFEYRVSPAEGTDSEQAEPGQIRLLAESAPDSILRHADNITMSPWGDLIICEDTADHCGLVGIRPDGRQYALADNAYTRSELAGICFSPDGKSMFVNIQEQGLTLAISGPWPTTPMS